MKIIISESAGRTQAWFDNLSKRDQKAYLEAHPNSKYRKAKPVKSQPKSAAPKLNAKTQNIKNKLDALRKKLATAKPDELPGIRKQIQAAREQIAATKSATKPAAPAKRMEPLW